MKKVKDKGARLVVVYFHWGSELETRPDEDQIYLAHLAIDQGADLVLGAHPHVIQPLETYKGHTICYSYNRVISAVALDGAAAVND